MIVICLSLNTFYLKADSEKHLLISTTELSEIIKEPNVMVVDARSSNDYNTLHITGAINLFHKDLYKTDGIEGEYKPLIEIESILKLKGLSPDKTIIFYDEGSGKYASRLFYTFELLGYKNLKILNGQFEAWKIARKPVTSTASITKKSEFTVQFSDNIIVDMNFVKNLNNAILIDTRPNNEFNGTEGRFEPKGHIPGAINLNWEAFILKGSFKSKEEIINLLLSKGITADKDIVIYCNTGIFATVAYFAIKHIAEYPSVKVYEGGIAEWVSIKDNPIVTGN